jgi:hypothetical protein
MKVEIEPHDTRIFLLHPLLNRPQLIGTSRHITGAYSILELSWDASKNSLSGSSQMVPGETYSLWVYVPQGLAVSQVRATTSEGQEISVHHELLGNSLKVSIQGQRGLVGWEAKFKS